MLISNSHILPLNIPFVWRYSCFRSQGFGCSFRRCRAKVVTSSTNISDRSQKRASEGINSRLDHTIAYKIVLPLSIISSFFSLPCICGASFLPWCNCIWRQPVEIWVYKCCLLSHMILDFYLCPFLNFPLRSIVKFSEKEHLISQPQKCQPTETQNHSLIKESSIPENLHLSLSPPKA